jgi:hypothetical protein
MAVEEGGARTCLKSDIRALRKGETEPYRVRRAAEADLPFIAGVHREGMKRYLLSCLRSRPLWRYEFDGRRRQSIFRQELRVIETRRGERIGFASEQTGLWGDAFGVSAYELKPGVSWLAVTPSVVRQVAKSGERHAAREKKELRRFAFHLGTEHPAYEVLPWRLSGKREAWALYLRVPDLPGFLRHIAPALERRLAESVAVGYTGELKLSFYRDGVRMKFRRGRLTEAEPWRPDGGQSASFPGLTFLQVLFGRRSHDELRSVYPDCIAANEEAVVLLGVLFPKKASSLWLVG